MPLNNPVETHTSFPQSRLLPDQGARVAAFPIPAGPSEAYFCCIHGSIKKRHKPDWT